MSRKIAVLSNVNLSFVLRMLRREFAVYEGEGYGNELGLLLNKDSSYHKFAPEITFFVIDLMELIEHDLWEDGSRIQKWFARLRGGIRQEEIYYISDAYLWGTELSVLHHKEERGQIERLWQQELYTLQKDCSNVRILPYGDIIRSMGEESAFSLKMWYLGRILHTNGFQQRLCALISNKAGLEGRTARKVLLLDLDNTLWGGLAGEAEHTPVALSEEHEGLAYKNLQRTIRLMQEQGVVLGIVSKNNEEDAMKIIKNHPHMVLLPECFAIKQINWEPKHENILRIAKDLNLGTESFVFWDDSPAERELVKKMLPKVAVPDFPKHPEELAAAMSDIYREYFEQAVITTEDREKTAQYLANEKREQFKEESGDFEDYLRELQIAVIREEAGKHTDRLVQLINKTNQFNLTTIRFTSQEFRNIMEDKHKRIFAYRVKDRFGDNGIVAAVIVDTVGQIPVIEEFVMSCRVMGRRVEEDILREVEKEMASEGFPGIRGRYIRTAKNKPVEMLYEKLGYQVTSESEEGKEYQRYW